MRCNCHDALQRDRGHRSDPLSAARRRGHPPGLALVAGGVLIANSVGLAMLDRRREMRIFKAIGYSSARLLTGIAVATAIAFASAVTVAWRPTHARPLAVLRQEG